jgi:hydrogenase maturation factor
MIMGEMTAEDVGKVLLKIKIGGTRILSVLTGDQLTRIC